MPRVGTAAAVAAVAAVTAAEPLPQQQPYTSGLQAAPPPVASCLSDLVELNVGGTLFTTNRATLEESQPQSMLAALVSGRHGPPRRDAQVRGAECVFYREYIPEKEKQMIISGGGDNQGNNCSKWWCEHSRKGIGK